MDFASAIRRLWPNGNQKVPGLVEGIISTAPAVFAKYHIDSTLVLAHIMAQISHECGAGHDVVENMNYSAQRMMQVWPSRFPNLSSAEPYAGNPKLLANKVYNGRMGNRPGSDDGYNFRGRGASQTTGRNGYERVAKATGIDVVAHPEYLIDPLYFLECGVSDFINCGCMAYALKDDIFGVTKRLNGGTVGLVDRRAWLDKWKRLQVDVPVSEQPEKIGLLARLFGRKGN
jgi:putative chitinase